MKRPKILPKFKNEAEERKFWETNDTTDYFDIKNPVMLDLSNLQRSTRPITVRLPETLVRKLKMIAHKKDVPYQSLLKVFLDDKVREEMRIYA